MKMLNALWGHGSCRRRDSSVLVRNYRSNSARKRTPRRRHPWLIFSLTIILFAAGCENTKTYAQDSLKESQYFKLKDLSGEEVSLAETLKKNKAVLINFWATWCPPCREEIPGLISLQEKHGEDSFTILGVDVGESAQKVSSFAQRTQINYPVLLDHDQGVAEKYGIVGIPTSLLVDSSGKILGSYHSYSNKLIKDVEKALE